MKKILALMAAAMIIIWAMPLVTVGTAPESDGYDDIYNLGSVVAVDGTTTPAGTTSPPKNNETDRSYDKKTTILARIGGQTVEITLHDYLIGVLSAEMPASFPEEALKAQALAARTYTLYKMELYKDETPADHEGAVVCDDITHCKAFATLEEAGKTLWKNDYEACLKKITAAVEDTCGLIAIYEGKPIAAVFHSASDGYTEAAVDVWGSEIPYLAAVETGGGQDNGRYFQEVTVALTDFTAAFLQEYPEADFSKKPSSWFKNSVRSAAGGIIDVEVGGIRVKGTFIRQIAGLSSTNFKIKTDDQSITFYSEGYGHGVGLSQYGARDLALKGKTFDEIIKHYYMGVELLQKS